MEGGWGYRSAAQAYLLEGGWGYRSAVAYRLEGMGVLVGLGNKILVGVRDGTRVEVAENLPSRVRVGGSGVQVTKCLVGVTEAMAVGEGAVCVNVGVGVGMYSEIPTSVSAAAVLMGLEKAESTISWASISEAPGVMGFARAAAETMQIRLNPITPAARTVNGPEYSRTFTLVSLHLRRIKGGFASATENHVFGGRKVLSRFQV